MKQCHACGKEYASEKKQPGPKETCESCLAYLHACLNCRFHDERTHNQCYIPNTEWVADKAGPNFCDEFEFADDAHRPSPPSSAARHALGDLFGDDGEAGEKKTGLDDFKNLFGG